ncbi:MAG: sigma-70 family RNA polymerase sigma factor, partial [Chitinivibrionales bacterium]|nr:sigma-70 family RNA polymerase sigma factor [Chitinivibrionales bacterium]
WWIRQAILQALADQSRIVKLPINRVGTIYKIAKEEEKFEQKHGRLPAHDEIASNLHLDEKNVTSTRAISRRHISLDAPIGANNDSSHLDVIHDEGQKMPDDTVTESSFREGIRKSLKVLNQREKSVIKLYFGLGEETPHTLDEIGQRMNVTRERVRQIKEHALKRLKQKTTKEFLRNYLH